MAGVEFIVPSLNHLLAMKFHAMKQSPKLREMKDLLDVAVMIKENKVNVSSDDFRDLCLRYGTPEIYKKILDQFK